MFRLSQIISASKLIRNFSDISALLQAQPQALLITQKSKEYLVLVNAEIFERLMEYQFQKTEELPSNQSPE